jgi:hydrogenase maturation protease
MNRRKKMIVIGLGNPLSGDDGFGSRVLDLLKKTASHPDVDFKDAHTDLLGQIESFADYDCVLLIDAILDPERKLGLTGQVVVIDEDAFLSWPESSHGVHQMSPLLAVKLFRKLYPEAKTEIILAGLLVDHLEPVPVYATEAVIREAFETLKHRLHR